VKAEIRYVPENIILDLADPGLGHPRGWEIVEHYQSLSRRERAQFSRKNPAFICLPHKQGSNPGLYLKNINGVWWAWHYEAGDCSERIRLPATMSDEHKRQAEYWCRAATDAGWRADMEHVLPGTRPDVFIDGTVATGIEVQRTYMSPSRAVARTNKASAAGTVDLWFTTESSVKWAWYVPTVLTRELGIPGEGQSWDTLPQRRSVTAAGLRRIRPAKCAVENFGRCPYGRRRHCGKLHPRPLPWLGLTVDDVAARFPGGEITTVRFTGLRDLKGRKRDAIFLVPPADRALYEELTGLPADGTAPSRGRGEQAGTVPCLSPQPITADVDRNAHLGAWERCAECNRKYRPINIWGRCYDCRYVYGLPLITER
jgi:hypothetical protein